MISEARRLRSYSGGRWLSIDRVFDDRHRQVSNPGGDPMIGWIFPGKDTCPGRTANLTGGIATGEFHAPIGNTVDIWAFVKIGAFIAQISGTHVIH